MPCGPINDIGEGVELAESLGLGPRVEVGEGDRAVTVVRNPISFSDADVRYRLPPPELGEHSDEIKAWLRSRRRTGAGAMTAEGAPTLPDRHRDVDGGRDHPARSGPRATT